MGEGQGRSRRWPRQSDRIVGLRAPRHRQRLAVRPPAGHEEDFSAWDDGALQNLGIWYEYPLWVGFATRVGKVRSNTSTWSTPRRNSRIATSSRARVSQGATDNYLAAHPNWNAERFSEMTLLLPKV